MTECRGENIISEVEDVAGALQEYVAELMNVEPGDIEEEDNLFDHGISSLKLAEVVVFLRRFGYDVDFSYLAENPSLRAWKSILRGRR